MTRRDDVANRLEEESGRLQALVRADAGWLLRFEAVEDLVQGARCRVLDAAEGYEEQGTFSAWVTGVTRRFLGDRRRHWAVRRRGASAALRVTSSEATGAASAIGIAPRTEGPGPRTTAERRELLVLASQALDTLPDGDRQLIDWTASGVSLTEQAERRAASYAATQRAAHRAFERLRVAMRALSPTDWESW